MGLDSFHGLYARSTKEANLETARGSSAFRLVEVDVRDERALAELPEVDAVIHLAARVGVRPSIQDPVSYSDVNVLGTTRLLRFVRDRSISASVFASSSSVYGNLEKAPSAESDPVGYPISPYAATKRAGELLCHSSTHLDGVATMCVRLFTVYGPRQRPDLAIHKFAGLMAAGEPIPMFGDGTTYRDYTYVSDIVDGIAKALRWVEEHPARHEIANLAAGHPIRLEEMIRLLGEAMGIDPRIEFHPDQPGDVARTFGDIDKARALLEYEPAMDRRLGIRRFVEWFRNRT